MKNVLAFNKTVERSRDKGVVVYVSPNKALVNQVSADVYQRYGPVFGTATEDHQDRALTSEVLITVPSILEKLLLSPERAAWVKSIKVSANEHAHTQTDANKGSVDDSGDSRLTFSHVSLSLSLSAVLLLVGDLR